MHRKENPEGPVHQPVPGNRSATWNEGGNEDPQGHREGLRRGKEVAPDGEGAVQKPGAGRDPGNPDNDRPEREEARSSATFCFRIRRKLWVPRTEETQGKMPKLSIGRVQSASTSPVP